MYVFVFVLQHLRSLSSIDVIDFLQLPLLHFDFVRRSFRSLAELSDVTSDERARLSDISRTLSEQLAHV